MKRLAKGTATPEKWHTLKGPQKLLGTLQTKARDEAKRTGKAQKVIVTDSDLTEEHRCTFRKVSISLLCPLVKVIKKGKV